MPSSHDSLPTVRVRDLGLGKGAPIAQIVVKPYLTSEDEEGYEVWVLLKDRAVKQWSWEQVAPIDAAVRRHMAAKAPDQPVFVHFATEAEYQGAQADV